MVPARDRTVGDRRRLLVTHPSPDLYGSDRQMLETLTAFLEEGWSVTVVLPSDGPLVPLIRERGADVVVTPFPVVAKALLHPRRLPVFALRALASVLQGARMLRRERPDLVLVNTITNPTWLASSRLARVPVLCHVHEAEEGQRRVVRWGLSVPLVLARGIIANSHAARRNLVDVLPRLAGRTVVVHNGVPRPPDEPAPPAVRSSEDPLRLVVVGRLSPRKGSDVALEALALVRAAGVDAHLTFCGAVFPGYEWFEEQLRHRASQPDLEGAVTFAGYVHPTWPALAAADVAVVPSRTEPFGNVAVEAQLARRPVVVSAVQGLVEIVDDATVGRAVPPDDATALAAALVELARDPGLARSLADEGNASALRRFTLDHYRRGVVSAARSLGRGDVPAGPSVSG